MDLPHRESFLSTQKQVQVAWDSTSLSSWIKCPTKYFYQIVLGYRPKTMSVDLDFGLIVHSGLEVYWRCRAEGKSHTDAQEDTVRIILTLHWQWKTSHTAKNLWNALRSIVWHTESFQEDNILRIGDTLAVELPFKYDLGFSVGKSPAAYCGHMDRVENDNVEQTWVKDYKTTKSALDFNYFAGYTPSTQLPGYRVAAEIVLHRPIAGVIVDAIQVGVNFTRFAKGHIFLSEASQDEWMKDAVYHIKTATSVMASNDALDPLRVPRNTESCFGCQFRSVCSLPPSIRLGTLESVYERKYWDPILRKEAE